MRSVVLIVTLSIAGCSSDSITFEDDGVLRDLAAPVDMTDLACNFECSPILSGCADLLSCTNACGSQACLTKCHKMATPQANAYYAALDACTHGACSTAADGGTGPCVSGQDGGMSTPDCDTCLVEAQTGASATGASNGMCCSTYAASTGACVVVNPPTAPCGACVDQLLACWNDI